MKFQRHYPATKVSISAPEELLMIPMDIILIEQVLINLMENAVQHGKTNFIRRKAGKKIQPGFWSDPADTDQQSENLKIFAC